MRDPLFRARGTLYLGARDYYDATIDGGAETVARALSPELSAFLSQIFVASAMYDALPILSLSRAAAEILGVPHMEVVRRNAAWLAERDIRGAYKVIFSVLKPSFVAARLPRLTLRYFDFGEADADVSEDGRCVARQGGIPAPLKTWFAAAVEGFVPVALRIAGAKSERVRFVRAVKDGEHAGVETYSLHFEFSWS